MTEDKENQEKDLDNICEECKEENESVSQNLILTGFAGFFITLSNSYFHSISGESSKETKLCLSLYHCDFKNPGSSYDNFSPKAIISMLDSILYFE